MIRKDNILTILSSHGFRVASINVPMTYPPYRVNGIIVSGIETPKGRVFAYPLSLYFKLVKRGYSPELDTPYIPGKEKEFLNKVYLMIERRKELLFTILNDGSFDLILFHLTETDRVSHTFWRFMDESHPHYPGENPFKNAILEVYKKADELLEKILKKIDKGTLLIVLSDHGFGPEHYRLNLNNWLLEKNHMFLKNEFTTAIKNY